MLFEVTLLCQGWEANCFLEVEITSTYPIAFYDCDESWKKLRLCPSLCERIVHVDYLLLSVLKIVLLKSLKLWIFY